MQRRPLWRSGTSKLTVKLTGNVVRNSFLHIRKKIEDAMREAMQAWKKRELEKASLVSTCSAGTSPPTGEMVTPATSSSSASEWLVHSTSKDEVENPISCT